ncbi:somatostatin receptor type 2-like [Eurosta solidaginis]|uniref:somatostatin receptor type 2-like n=1 Tax=Eurosta solidaginis TaxID=178769 RepID=UPI0035310960
MWKLYLIEVALIIFTGALVSYNFVLATSEATAHMTPNNSENYERDLTTTSWPIVIRATDAETNAKHAINATVDAHNKQLSTKQELNTMQWWSAAKAEVNTTSKRSRTNIGNATMLGNRTYTLAAIGGRNFQRRQTFYEYCMEQRNSVADLSTLILYSFVCIVGLCGNTLVIYVVLRYSKMQTVTNIYILNLAIADEFFLIGIPFLLYTMRICSWRFGDFMCKIYMVSSSITQFTSSIFLLIMSADRYIAVCHPIASPKYRTQHIAKIVSAIAWLTSAVLMLPVIFYASTVSQEDGVNLSCNIEWPETYKKHSATTFTLYTFFLGFATPLCFILCFYYLVIRKLQTVGSKHKSKEKKRSHRKVTRLVLTVITVYIFCWLPYWVSQLALINSNPIENQLSRFEIFIFLLLFFLIYVNSAMNPILYAFLSDNFRKSFSKAFTCMTKSEVNAQLQAEPSLLPKQNSTKRRQTRIQKASVNAANLQAATNANNNSSVVTTSSTNTAPSTASDNKVTTTACTNGAAAVKEQPNGRAVSCSANVDAEEMILVMEDEHPVCALVESAHAEGNVMQTDL